MASIIHTIEKGWSFAQVKNGVEGEYAAIEKTPTSVHAELIKFRSSLPSLLLLPLTFLALFFLLSVSGPARFPTPTRE